MACDMKRALKARQGFRSHFPLVLRYSNTKSCEKNTSSNCSMKILHFKLTKRFSLFLDPLQNFLKLSSISFGSFFVDSSSVATNLSTVAIHTSQSPSLRALLRFITNRIVARKINFDSIVLISYLNNLV
jgi:hypothetical protein